MAVSVVGDTGATESQALTDVDADTSVEAPGYDGDATGVAPTEVADGETADPLSGERGGAVAADRDDEREDSAGTDDEVLPELTVSIDDVEGEVGERVAVDLNVTSFSDGSGDVFGSYSFVLSYDEEVVSFEGLETGVWDEPASINASDGVVAFADFDAAGETPAEPVLTLEFEVLEEGSSAIEFDDEVSGIPATNTINNEFARPYAIQFEEGSAGTGEESLDMRGLSVQRGPGAGFFGTIPSQEGFDTESVSTTGVQPGQSALATSSTSEVPEFPVGDATEEGSLSISDAQAIANFIVGDPPEDFNEFLANTTRQDEGIQIADAQLIANYLVGDSTPANTTITGFGPTETIVPGDSVEQSPTVTNVGELGTIQSVDYRIAEDDDFENVVFEERIDVVDLTPEAFEGNQTMLDVNVTPEVTTAGEYTQGLFSEGVPPTGPEDINGSATAPLEIEPAEPDEVTVEVEPEETTAGEDIEGRPAANVTDEFGNTIEGVNVSVEVTGDELDGGTTTVETDESGIATFDDLMLETVGTYTLTFEVPDVDTAETDEFDIVSAAQDSVTVDTQPAQTVAGETVEGPPTANVTDEFGNAVEGVNVSVEVTGEDELDGGTTTAVTDGSGIATFGDLMLEDAGAYTLTFDADGVEEDATTNAFDVVSAAPDDVSVEVEPAQTTAGETIEGPPAANVVDEFGNVVEGVNVSVEVTGEDELDGGTTTVETDESGTATFGDLVVETVGTYTLTFDAAGVAENATTGEFDIVSAAVDSVELEPEDNQTIEPGETVALNATAYDEFGNVNESSDDEFTWDAEGGSISDVGLFDEIDHGTYDVTATLDGVTSAATTVTVLQSNTFEVTILDADDITENETLQVNAYIENVGDLAGTQTVEFDAEGLGSDSAEITLDADDDTVEQFEVETDIGDAGDYTVTVSSDNDTATSNVTVLESVFFDVFITDTNSPVEGGEALSVTANIENTGEVEGTQTVTMEVAGLSEDDSQEITLDGGESVVETFTANTGEEDDGEYTATVSSEDDSDSTPVTVLEPAEFVVTILTVNEPVEGEDLNVTASIENTGEVEGTQTVTMDAGVLGDASKELTLDGDESTTETFTVGTEDGDAGEYTAEVASEDDTDSTPVTVLAAPEAALSELDVARQDGDAVLVEGDDEGVSVVVENVGDVQEDFDVSLEIGSVSESTTVTDLDGGASEVVTFSGVTGDLGTGEYGVTAEADVDDPATDGDDEIAGDLEVVAGFHADPITFSSAGDGPTITLTESMRVSQISLPENEVQLNPKVVFESSVDTEADAAPEGEWTTLTNLDVSAGPLTVDPIDKQATSITGDDVDEFEFRDVDVGSDETEIEYTAFSTVEVTLTDLPASTDVEAVDTGTDSQLADGTTDGDGEVTLTLESGSNSVTILELD